MIFVFKTRFSIDFSSLNPSLLRPQKAKIFKLIRLNFKIQHDFKFMLNVGETKFKNSFDVLIIFQLLSMNF